MVKTFVYLCCTHLVNFTTLVPVQFKQLYLKNILFKQVLVHLFVCLLIRVMATVSNLLCMC